MLSRWCMVGFSETALFTCPELCWNLVTFEQRTIWIPSEAANCWYENRDIYMSMGEPMSMRNQPIKCKDQLTANYMYFAWWRTDYTILTPIYLPLLLFWLVNLLCFSFDMICEITRIVEDSKYFQCIFLHHVDILGCKL